MNQRVRNATVRLGRAFANSQTIAENAANSALNRENKIFDWPRLIRPRDCD
jgi:hypothetical protein